MARFHPQPERLLLYAEGSLTLLESLIIAAHCDMCSRCQHIVEQHTRILSAKVFDFPLGEGSKTTQLDQMCNKITQLPLAKGDMPSRVDQEYVELDGKTFPLPRTLQRVLSKTGSWSGLVGKLWQARVNIDSPGLASFIYMGQGGRVPEHSHCGTEYTLVLHGEYSDELNQYRTGDFVTMGQKQRHTPYSEVSSGCLVFSVLDQPLHFTSGLARLLNPFSHLFFR